jgi:hypothetical protein
MDSDFFVDIGFTVLLRLIKDKSRWRKFIPALKKLRDKLNELPLDN